MTDGAMDGSRDEVTLRETSPSDLPLLFEFQRDREGYWMAGFTASDPADRDAYLEIWERIRADPRTIMRTILYNGEVAGDVLSHESEPGKPETGYWLGKAFWGKGIATRALRLFLAEIPRRPMYARVIKDNVASLHVLEKCGFRITGEQREYANARDHEVELYTLTLEASAPRPSSPAVTLRAVEDADLPVFFEQQRDPDANFMAAFVAKDPNDRDAFMDHWARIRADPGNVNRTVLVNGDVAGETSSYQEEPGKPEITYWLGKEFWGQGIATRALTLFLDEMTARSVYARAAKDNAASLRVLEKCGFAIMGEGRGYANARGAEIEEYELRRDV
ncbi:MAG TPA: GNAT family N-acetyltransferase [Ktedonobacterales bacterium]